MGDDVEDAPVHLGAMYGHLLCAMATLVDHPIGPPDACTDRWMGRCTTYGSSDVSGMVFDVIVK